MSNKPIIKVCGLSNGENMRQVAGLGVDWVGMVFWEKSPRNVTMIPTRAGIIPDRGSLPPSSSEGRVAQRVKRVGVFVDEMAQNIVTRVVNFGLDLVQFHGHESPTLIRNLRLTLDPDIRPGIKFIKAITVGCRDDVAAYKAYEDCVDYLLFDTRCDSVGGSGRQFDWQLLDAYDGRLPFLLSGGIGPADAPRLRTLFRDGLQAETGGFPLDKCIGIDLNSRFEVEPGMKDIQKLKQFIDQLS